METLLQKIAELETKGADRFDPVRFCYIRAMARRSAGKSGLAHAGINRKITAALAEFQASFNTARKQAEDVVSNVCSKFPEAESKTRELFGNNEFGKVHSLEKRLNRRQRQPDLSELKNQVGQLTPDLSESQNQFCVDDLLQQQEQDVIASIANPADQEGPQKQAKKTEITSLKRFKKTMAKMQSERLVTKAINDCPEHAGPHNSQMLAINSLAALREISPAYLERFVSHINTLIWLKQAGEDVGKNKTKKKKKTSSKK